MRFVTDRDKGGILEGTDIGAKSGFPVLEVLKSKHQNAVIPPAEALESYDSVPAMINLDITADTDELIAKKLAGAIAL